MVVGDAGSTFDETPALRSNFEVQRNVTIGYVAKNCFTGSMWNSVSYHRCNRYGGHPGSIRLVVSWPWVLCDHSLPLFCDSTRVK
jgi:hypothetical protein